MTWLAFLLAAEELRSDLVALPLLGCLDKFAGEGRIPVDIVEEILLGLAVVAIELSVSLLPEKGFNEDSREEVGRTC